MRVLFLTLALVLSLVPASAQTAGGQSPVAMNSCNLIYDRSSLTATVNGLDVQFTNDSAKTATVVNVQADIEGTTQIIRDQGTFSPGIEIDHRYRAGGEQFALPAVLQSIFGGKPQVTCAIRSVQFADGSRWPAPAAAAQTGASPITVTPAALSLNGSGIAAARLILASGGGALAMSSNCGPYANVELLGSTSRDIALRVTPKAAGSCAITIRDENDNVVTVPVTVP